MGYCSMGLIFREIFADEEYGLSVFLRKAGFVPRVSLKTWNVRQALYPVLSPKISLTKGLSILAVR